MIDVEVYLEGSLPTGEGEPAAWQLVREFVDVRRDPDFWALLSPTIGAGVEIACTRGFPDDASQLVRERWDEYEAEGGAFDAGVLTPPEVLVLMSRWARVVDLRESREPGVANLWHGVLGLAQGEDPFTSYPEDVDWRLVFWFTE